MNFTEFKTQTVFKQRNAILVPENQSSNLVDPDVVSALYLELFSLGFRLTGEAYDGILRMSKASFKRASNLILGEVHSRLGLNVQYNVLYKGFPESVPDFDTYNFLRFCSILGNEFGLTSDRETLECGHAVYGEYLSSENFGACPVCQMASDTRLQTDGGAFYKNIDERLKFLKHKKIKVIDVGVGTDATFDEIVGNVMASKSSISMGDQQLLTVAFANLSKDKLDSLIPEQFGFKEVLVQCVAEYARRFTRKETLSTFGKHISTAKDVLRLAKEFRDRPLKTVDADYTVEDGFLNKDGVKTRVKYKLTNGQRKLIVSFLDKVDNACEDMITDRMEWVHLNKSVHFGQFKNKYPNAFKVTDRVFNHPETVQTYESIYEALLVGDQTPKLINHLKLRPGVFARVLHSVLRKHEAHTDDILGAFEKVAPEASMRVLVSLNNLFQSELNHYHDRIYVDAETSKVKMIESARTSLPEAINQKAYDVVSNAINAKLKQPETLTAVVIDPILKQYKMPLKLRDVGEGKEKRERGSVVSVDQGNTVRAYIYWHENETSDRVDLDLSVELYDETFSTHIEESSFGYHNQVDGCMTHSGDIQSAPNGASEMVDIDVTEARAKGARYALVFVNSYAGASFASFEAFAGIQSGDNLGGQHKINPLKVETRFELTGSARSAVAVIYDLEKGEIIHGDMGADSVVGGAVGDYRGPNVICGQFLLNEAKTAMSMYEYLERFAKANRAEVVEKTQPDIKYDYVFDYSTTQNIDEFNSKWLQ